MPSKISRVNQKESYNITVGWLNDFTKNLNKNAQIIEIFRNQNREKFATVEEKMSNLKSRVGFENIKGLKEESSLNVKKSTACGCSKCDKCDKRSDIKGKLEKVIQYANAMLEDRGDELSSWQIISECRDLPLYKEIEANVSNEKFVNYIKDMVSEKNSTSKDSDFEYISPSESHNWSDNEDMAVSYMKNK